MTLSLLTMILKPFHKSVLTGLLISCITTIAGAYPSSYYASRSRLNNGRWVKIKVSNVGMHQITHAQLREMGFNDPSRVNVYGYGGALLTDNTFSSSLPDDLPAQPVLRTDDKIIFYGESDVRYDISGDAYTAKRLRNYYASAGYYFLSDATAGESAEPEMIPYNNASSSEIDYHNSIQYIEKEVTCPANSGARFFGTNFLNEARQTFSFNAPDPYEPSSYIGAFRYEFAANSSNSLGLSVETGDIITTYVANREAQAIKSSKIYYTTKDGIIKFMMNEQEADSVYTFTCSIPDDKKYSFAAIDYATFAYYRHNNITGYPQLRMVFREVNTSNYFTITGGNENTQVWNVTEPHNVFAYTTRYNETEKTISATFEKKYSQSTNGHAYIIAFNPDSELYPVEYEKEISNQDIHSMSTPDMLIITNATMRKYAEDLAQAHRECQGIDVIVLDQEEIFNEFSSGTPSGMAYRRVAKMFYDRDASRFRHLMLFGGGTFDNRSVIIDNRDNLLTYQCEDIYMMNSPSTSYCADSYFGMLGDDFTISDIHIAPMLIGVGRIPVVDEKDAASVTAKVIDYLKNPPLDASANKALLLADDGDYDGHMLQVEELCDTILGIAPHVTITKAYNSMYPWYHNDALQARNVIIQTLSNGVRYFGYTGHGSATGFAKEFLWKKEYVKSIGYNTPPIAMLSTCDALAFDRSDNGIGETMLYQENGGCIAVVGAARTVYKDFNQYLNLAFAAELYSAAPGDCLGDAYRKAHNRAATAHSDSKLGINTLCYNLAGDPALPLYTPEYKVKTTHINGDIVDNDNDSTLHTIYPLSKNHIQGLITDTEGNTLNSFNGTVTLTVYDAPYEISTYVRETSDTSRIILRDEDILTETTVEVINGTFDAEIITPESLRPEKASHISYYAVSDDRKRQANGTFNQLSINNYDDTKALDDTTAPVISEFYINEPSFCNGDLVNSNIVIYATILPDESGLNKTTATIGVGTKLTLDGEKSYPYIRSTLITDMDGYTTITFPINDLEDGHHTLTLSVSDNAGNRSEQELSFTVINSSAQAVLVIAEEPARTEANLSLEHNFVYEPKGRLVIEDAAGNTVFTKENCSFPYTWNLHDSNGNTVADGNYNCYAILNGNKQYGSTPKTRLIVIK